MIFPRWLAAVFLLTFVGCVPLGTVEARPLLPLWRRVSERAVHAIQSDTTLSELEERIALRDVEVIDVALEEAAARAQP